MVYTNLFCHFTTIGTALFITVINYSATDPTYAFWNVSHHFMTLLTLILELFLNNMYVRADHYPFNLSWAVLYLICIWPVVVMNKIPDWPYLFLATDTYFCCLYYIGLFTADFLFYYVFYALSKLKYSLRSQIQSNAPNNNDNALLVYYLSERSPLRDSSQRFRYLEPIRFETVRSPIGTPLASPSRSYIGDSFQIPLRSSSLDYSLRSSSLDYPHRFSKGHPSPTPSGSSHEHQIPLQSSSLEVPPRSSRAPPPESRTSHGYPPPSPSRSSLREPFRRFH